LSIRSRLLWLVLSVLVPAVFGAAWVIAVLYDAEHRALERNLRDSTHAVSMMVERELNQRAMLLKVLSQSRLLEPPPILPVLQLAQFEQQARRSLQGLEGWIELVSADQELINTRLPAGSGPRPRPVDAPPLQQRATVGNLDAPVTADVPMHLSIVQPIARDGSVVLNLRLSLLPGELQRIIDEQQLSPGWVGTVLDGSGRIVAQRGTASAQLGAPATAELKRLIAGRAEGLFDSVLIDGNAVSGYFSPSAQGWTYIMTIPRAQFAGMLPTAVRQLAFGAILLLSLSVLSALLVARRILEPVTALRLAADRMRAGLPVEYRNTGIRECDAVGAALVEAAQTMQGTHAELQRQVRQAVQRTRAAEQSVSQHQRAEALGRLTGGVAHDFNNLLGVIGNSAYLMQRHADNPELRMPLAAVLRSVEAGSQLTRHLMRVAGRHPSRPSRLQPLPYLGEMRELLGVVLGHRIALEVKVAPDTRALQVDASELDLALLNLALNARDALPSGGRVWIDAHNASAEDQTGLVPGHYVVITISDDGVGMDEETARRVFEPFFTTKGPGAGTGLGLSQVHGFCVQSGGRALVNSTPKLGTSITLLLPAATDPPLIEPPAADGAIGKGRLGGWRVLLVEDNVELATSTQELLRAYGCSVSYAGTPAEALACLDDSRQARVFDVVLSDVVMPGPMDGVALARRLRERDPKMPVVLISGYSSALSGDHGFPVLGKPCTPAQLLDTLGEAIAAARGTNAAGTTLARSRAEDSNRA
jgi:signal transduction histidine kinase